MQTDIERKSVFMLMPCQTERPATLWHHLLIMRQDYRSALGMNQTMLLLANTTTWQQADWVLWNRFACVCSVWREWRVWMDLFVYWCLCLSHSSGLVWPVCKHACTQVLTSHKQEDTRDWDAGREESLSEGAEAHDTSCASQNILFRVPEHNTCDVTWLWLKD